MFKPLIAALLIIFSSTSLARQVVNVSGVYFPPYAFGASAVTSRGLLPELIAALNNQQAEFEFIIVPTSLQRRYADLNNGRVDISLFENPRWGWQDIPNQSVDMGLEDAEVFVARTAQGRQQAYFDKILGKRLALFSGYHYAFAGFNTDPGYLAKAHNAIVSRSLDGNIMMVVHRRADIALVTRSYLKAFFESYPKYAKGLLISERVDQVYAHHAILRNNAPISAQRFSQLLEDLRQSGQLDAIFAPYDIKVVRQDN
ncbi:transporter substrate-binding domain-containing protein [Pseudomonas sp. S9]|uniref:transporter substrate-binding domain-containing protein n=1 Tax=Pseudomonas sp. S9 TaxID=686578 RepID=UPI000255692D|nr:transporter substrate-binding domain-containing protein [Pseudomonas sp. S9]